MSDYYYYNNINEKVDFKFSTREAFLELQKVKEEKNVYPILPVSMNFPFLIATSLSSSKVYFYMVGKTRQKR